MARQSTIALIILKLENTVNSMRSSESGIKQFVEVNYKNNMIEEMCTDFLSTKLRKSDPDQPIFTQAMNGDESVEYWEV